MNIKEEEEQQQQSRILTNWISKSEIVTLRAENGKKSRFGEIHRSGQQKREYNDGHKHGGFAD